MEKALRGLSGVVFCAAMSCHAAPDTPDHKQVAVASQGVTDIGAAFGASQVAVRIATHKVDIGKTVEDWVKRKRTPCAYSLVSCSLVDYLEVTVDGNALWINRSVYADLVNISAARLDRKENGRFVLILRGGDLAENYTVEIAFDNRFVRQRELISSLNGQVLQRTTYFLMESLD